MWKVNINQHNLEVEHKNLNLKIIFYSDTPKLNPVQPVANFHSSATEENVHTSTTSVSEMAASCFLSSTTAKPVRVDGKMELNTACKKSIKQSTFPP